MEVKRPRCSFCEKEAIITIKHSRLRLCEDHFEEYLLKRVKRIKLPKKVLLGLSGGKDSVVALHLLKKLGVEVLTATVDTVPWYTTWEGDVAKRVAEAYGVPHIMIYAKELYGFTALSFKQLKRKPCSICSKLRRHALELLARRSGINFIATGHNMDDMASLALAFILRGDHQELRKVRPLEPPRGVARGRVKPLFWVSEKEVIAFALAKKLPWIKAVCPLYTPSSTFVDFVKEKLLEMEEKYPGVRRNLLRAVTSHDYPEEGVPRTCKLCGGPSWGEVCSVCSLRQRVGRLEERPLRPRVETAGEGEVLVIEQGRYTWVDVGKVSRGHDVLRKLGLGPERAVLAHLNKPLPPESTLKGEPAKGELVVYVLPRLRANPRGRS